MKEETGHAARDFHIAIIGMAGRFPGARNLDEFWKNLESGIESVKWFSDEELLAAGESEDTLRDPTYVKACPVLDGVGEYDALMNPQHRLFLETAREALENAGYAGESSPGLAGVFTASAPNHYAGHHLRDDPRSTATMGHPRVRRPANDASCLATHVSYHLDLKGPSMDVHTACSSALVAVHLAAQSLLAGECDLALAGAVAVWLPQDRGYFYEEGGLLSPDGHTRAFDARAGGTVFGSGAGCVVLERLEDALAGGDEILAVIRGSAVNNDGSAKVSYLAPSVSGLASAVAEALAVAGVDPESISYVEAHGSGTRIGDALELAALTQAYRASTDRCGYAAIGSVKPNIGHLCEAAGIAGLIKTILALRHAELPPSLHCETPTPDIDFPRTPFYVVRGEARPWRSESGPRRAGVTALGIGGTNAHVILEEAPLSADPSERRRCSIARAPARAERTKSESHARPAPGAPYVAPRNDIERELAGWFSELLGVKQVSVHDGFFELGGKSLAALQLFERIRRRYGIDLPLSTLFEASTIARCAEIVDAERGRAAAAEAPRSRWSSLVPMQPAGARPPFFCVAGMGGHVVNLHRLARLVGDDQPFYGLEPPGLDGKQERLYRVEDLAAHYIREIVGKKPEGPYLIGGYSGGGVAAFEMACQLAKLGREVAFLGFIDSFSPSLPERSVRARLQIHARRAASLGPAYLGELARRRLVYQRREALRLGKRALGKVFPERYRYDNIADAWVIAERAYAPDTFPGAATLFRAEEESSISLWTAFEIDELHGWGRFVAGGVEVEVCPGDHTTMCEEPHVEILAAKLRACLDRALHTPSLACA